ncbi:PREDICTED: protein FAR1-RELATED SEQUENCE 5-like [Nelumbo nucifera]|uniref:Protein FAR1-RELATED SEQUENCE n=1 Tax=Nelumbo nucifera TaxID=4432 RepID=A0A1U8AP94_NELNU|nr:PREDICTED: protein FAR1-RELATED SEQUENCE 5-like [Nelumbo nucifera]
MEELPNQASSEDCTMWNREINEITEERRVDFNKEGICGSPTNASFSQQNMDSEVSEKQGVPEVGMVFQTLEDAYSFYNGYAKNAGFSVRIFKGYKTKSGVWKSRAFVCSYEGFRGIDKRRIHAKFRRDIRRTGCAARIRLMLQENGKYRVTEFEGTHNHQLLNPRSSYMLRSHKNITIAHDAQADLITDSCTHPKATLEFMDRPVDRIESIGFTSFDYSNHSHAENKKDMENGGARAIMKYFDKLQEENISSFHSIKFDEENQITNIFWADVKMLVDYSYFGDVICFDTTFKTNEERQPFAPFVGVNHHKQTIFFGAALMYDQSVESFKWVFHSFLKAMSGKQPKTILTDHDPRIANAIKQVFPDTCHRLCIWHIYQNATKHFSSIFAASSSFEKDFSSLIYDHEDEDEFLKAWHEMLEKYELKENTWLQELFEVKEKWSLVYGRNQFCADMKSTQRSKSVNSILRGYLKSSPDLAQFFNHFEKVVADCRQREMEMEVKMSQGTPYLSFPIRILKWAASIYTPTVFREFEKEYSRALDCDIVSKAEVGTTMEYRIKDCSRPNVHVVTFDPLNVAVVCSCKKFESVGLLCAHALCVLFERQLKQVPQQYLLKRWTRDAKDGATIDHRGHAIKLDPNAGFSTMFTELQRVARETSARAAEDRRAFAYLLDVYNNARKGVEEILKKKGSLDFSSPGLI